MDFIFITEIDGEFIYKSMTFQEFQFNKAILIKSA